MNFIFGSMEFSGVALCAEKGIHFHTFPLLLSGALIHPSSIGIHKSEDIPFIQLTGHNMGEPLAHSSFEMAELNLTKRFGLTGKINNFTNNIKYFVRGESFSPRKEICSQKFPKIAFSQLVGGFVGSKSQLGSSGRESCQIWDIIFDKLAGFCRAPQSACCSLFASKHPHSYNPVNNLPQEILESFCQEDVSTFDNSHIVKHTANMQEKVHDILPLSHTVSDTSVPLSVISPHMANGDEFCPASDVAKQSYAEVTKTFVVAQQNKQQCTTAPAVKTRGNFLQYNFRQFGHSADNWRCHCDSSIKKCRNEYKLASSCRKKSHRSKHNKGENIEKLDMTERSNRDTNLSESHLKRVTRKRNTQNMKQHSLQTVSSKPVTPKCHKKEYMDCSEVANDCDIDENSNCMKSREDKSAKPCTAIKCSSSTSGETDGCTVFTHEVEGGGMSVLIHAAGTVHSSPSNPLINQCSEGSPVRGKRLSECSTDSDDSFVIFESGVDCDTVVMALVSDSDLSEDGTVNHFSDDDDDDGGGGGNDDEESDGTEVRNKEYELWNSVTIQQSQNLLIYIHI
jgi:hypothetical protein